MNKPISFLLTASLSVSAVMAADGDGEFKLFGSVGLGDLSTHESSDTKDAAKLNEYRDLSSGAFGTFDLKGRGNAYYLDAFGENLGRDDQYLDFKGGKYTIFKYQLYENKIIHNWTFNARTPYSGVGGDTLTATLPNLNPGTWNTFNFNLKRDNIGGMFEMSNNSPWYWRVDANEVNDNGLKLIAGANGTSPGNGFTDKPFAIDTKTQNMSVEGGYATKQAQLSVNALYSKFTNNKEQLNWTNGFFGNQLDTSTLAPDSNYLKLGVNGVMKQLPVDSTLAGRLSYSRTKDDVQIATTALNTGGVYSATNPDRSTFNGDVVHETASLSLYSNPSKELDSRVYWNWFKKDNNSPTVAFTELTAGLTCGRVTQGATVLNPGDCVTETLSYKKNNFGTDVGYRLNPHNRIVAGIDYVDLERDRVDFDETKDKKATLEYKNTSLESLSTRMKYQHLERRSHFLEGSAGADANDPEYLNRFVARFDASNVDQNLFKLVLDAVPAESWDVSLEAIYKQNQYKDTALGRLKDNRQEYYISAGYGDIRTFRVMLFADIELVQYDSYHRNINTVSSGSGTTPNDTPSGDCQSSAPNCYDPNTAANSNNYNWGAKNKDRSWAVGLGTDWSATSRLKVKTSLIGQETKGTVDFAVQPGANPATPSVPINNYDNTKTLTFNLKGIYSYSKSWEFTGGYAYERFRFDDISYNGYQYTIGSGTGASYLSGAYAFPNYTMNSVYVVATYKF